ncbi:SsgA family sporulation/cell division regulator [Nonomuraea sp. NPDC059194]|uniref:SsgA family sporulation/cell division regulator n=1 Tax=Nonomuraea sp. NPDC059194 TaxID=3346764 RepID=UPI0036B399EE
MKQTSVVRNLTLWSVDRQPIDTFIRYDIADPYAVTLEFVDDHGRTTVSYLFGRELLIDGLHELVGQDLVVVGPHDADGYTTLSLTPEHGALPMDFYVATAVLTEFVEASCQLVASGSERFHLSIDQVIAHLLHGRWAA